MSDYIYGDDDMLGESNSGMQHTLGYGEQREVLGAAQALSRLRGLAQQRANRYQPIQKVLRSPFKDSTQIGLTASLTITSPSTNPVNQQTTAVTRVYKSFKPNKAVVTESIQFNWSASGQADFSTFVAVPIPNDILLVSAFSGADNCFPNAPSASSGINCSTFSSNALGVGISWPTLNGGIDMTVGFLVRPSFLAYANGSLSTAQAAFDDLVIESAIVTIDMTLLGPSLR